MGAPGLDANRKNLKCKYLIDNRQTPQPSSPPFPKIVINYSPFNSIGLSGFSSGYASLLRFAPRLLPLPFFTEAKNVRLLQRFQNF